MATPRPPGTPFNYAHKMNCLWRLARTEHIVLMNDDLVIATPDWLEALMTFAMEPDVGGVGARLLYPSGTLQHVGMAFGPRDACAHLFLDEPGDAPSYGNWADVHREYSVVTGAVFATRRSLLDEINGFDERFSLNWNDVDMCLRMRLLGLRIVYTPHAELIHYESASRGRSSVRGSEMALFLERWRQLFEDDPAYHPRLSRALATPVPLPWTMSGGGSAAHEEGRGNRALLSSHPAISTRPSGSGGRAGPSGSRRAGIRGAGGGASAGCDGASSRGRAGGPHCACSTGVPSGVARASSASASSANASSESPSGGAKSFSWLSVVAWAGLSRVPAATIVPAAPARPRRKPRLSTSTSTIVRSGRTGGSIPATRRSGDGSPTADNAGARSRPACGGNGAFTLRRVLLRSGERRCLPMS